MIFLSLEFPAGRWHATAWGTHVNEGVPEWPPCSWRLCRALIAAWHWKLQRRNEHTVRGLIEKLAGQSPDYLLPEATAAHTRHYMPVVTGPKETKTKVFDTFVHVSRGQSLWIRWRADLDPEERGLLAALCDSLNYLGRAESLAALSLKPHLPADVPTKGWTVSTEKSDLGDGGEPVRLLEPQPPAVYREWAVAQNASADNKAKGRKKTGTVPESLFEALQLDTADWKKEGWNLPPGARWVEFLRPRDCLKIAPHAKPLPKRTHLPKVARFAIVSKVPPSITQSLSLAERFHQALCRLLDGQESASLTGRQGGEPLRGNRHVYFLPECDPHGYVTHMTLHTAEGFDEAACRALGKLRKVWGMEGFDVKTVLLATGQPDDFSIASRYFEKSKTWFSLTPFVPVRHPKATRAGVAKTDAARNGLQIGSAEHDCWRLLEILAAELDSAGRLPVSNVSLTDPQGSKGTRIKLGLRDIPCLRFQRTRRIGDGLRAGERGYSLRIDFETEASLPFGLGYGAHFGLGLFGPVVE